MIYPGGGYLGLYSLLTEAEEIEFDSSADAAGKTRPLIWVNWYLDSGAIETYAQVALPDPASYYGGYKRPLILSFGEIRRALSDRAGHYEGSKWTWVASDLDPRIRTLLAGLTTRYNFHNRDIIGRMIADADRRLLKVPRVIFRGTLREASPSPERQFEFSAEDFLTSKFSRVSLDQQIPRYTIDGDAFPDAPDEALGKAVPIAYGLLSDENVVSAGLVKPVVTASVIGPAGSTTYRFAVTALDNRGNQAFNFDARTDHSGETDGDIITVTNAPSWEELSGSRYIELLISAPGANHVRIYGDVGGGGDLALLDQGDDDGGGNHHYTYGMRNGVRDIDRPKWESTLPTENNTSTDLGKGVVPVTYVGLRDISGTEYHEFIVCNHTCKAIHAVYQGHTRVGASITNAGGEFLVPWFPGWTSIFATLYRDFVGADGLTRRFTVIYAKRGTSRGDSAADGSNPITLNLTGIEDVGDGTGVAITKLPLIYRHFVKNFGFQDGLGGIAGWLDAPEWEDGTTQVDEESFDTAETIANTRIIGGYVGAALIGAVDERLSLREALRRFNLSCGVRCGFNRHSQFFVTMFDDRIATLDAARSVTQIRDIIKGSFSTKDRPADLSNAIVYSYKRRYTQSSITTSVATEFESASWEHPLVEVTDPTSITGYRETAKSRELEFFYVRSADVAYDIASRELMFTRYVPRLAYWRQPLSGLSIELGDTVKLTHLDGVGVSGGYVNSPVMVERHNFDPKKLSVYIEAWDVERLFSTSFRLGDDTWGVTWTTASAVRRQHYGFLADETTGLFSDGQPGKRLR